MATTIRKAYTFRCPLCAKTFTNDQPAEPCCTGPSESSDVHPMEIMRLVRVAKVDVDPRWAEIRAAGAMIMPETPEAMEREIRILRA